MFHTAMSHSSKTPSTAAKKHSGAAKKHSATKKHSTAKKHSVTKKHTAPKKHTEKAVHTCTCGAKVKKHHKKRALSPYMKFAGPTIKRLRAEQPGHPFGWYGKETGRLWHLKKAEAELKMK